MQKSKLISTDSLPRILMCKPTYFNVKYVINPWMEGNVQKTVSNNSKEQWDNLYSILSSFTKIELITEQPDIPDFVFTANAGLVLNKLCIISNFYHKERTAEESFFTEWFENYGFKCLHMPDNIYFEGAGDALFDRKRPILWLGYGFRSNKEAINVIKDWVPTQILQLKLTDKRFYHLDTCFCPLTHGEILYFPDAFDDASKKIIVENVPEEKLIPVTEADAVNFACNAVNINSEIILNNCSDKLSDKLKELGYNLHTTPLTEFMKSGGAAKCLTLILDEKIAGN